MLQETKAPPADLADNFTFQLDLEIAESKLPWRAIVAGLVNADKLDFTPIKTQPLGGSDSEALMVSRPGTLDAAMIKIKGSGEEITVVSLYSNWTNPVKQTGSSWIFADGSAHRLISDLSGLISSQSNHRIIAAGDLNILHGYGEYGSSYWGKRYNTVFDRMAALGLRFVGPQAPDGGRQAEPWPEEWGPSDHCRVMIEMAVCCREL